MNKTDETIYEVEMKEFEDFLNSLNGSDETKERFINWFIKSLNIAWEYGYELGKEMANFYFNQEGKNVIF